ncbi:MAG: 3-phosphoserine/phosphohydroxythreonine transaminase [Phycisphaerales bacterium]
MTTLLANRAASATSTRAFNFSAGPATLPEEVLREAQQDIWDIAGSGVGILEHSHRGPLFDRLLHEAVTDCRAVGGVPDTHEVLFIPGGATLQFGMIPMNFLHPGGVADYLDTGVWAHKATVEAQRYAETIGAKVNVAFDGRPTRYDHVPADDEIRPSDNATYFHYCSNNTVFATQFARPPFGVDSPRWAKTGLVCDASSDIFARPWDVAHHAMIYASGQKNLGPSGMVLVVIRRDFMAHARRGNVSMLDYRTYHEGESRPNTPNSWGIYLMGRVFKWIIRQGGVAALAKRNAEKARILYDAIDSSGGFYTGLARLASRSTMNVSFRLPTPELDDRFAIEAAKEGLDGLKGHRDAGGIRASIYNPMPREGCEALAGFMREFSRRNG